MKVKTQNVSSLPADKDMESLILDAARRVFLRRGHDGARMQEIADEAGINKALLHYYFRSKDKLFKAVFDEAFHHFLPRIAMYFQADMPLFEKLEKITVLYINLLKENPYIPMFILHEVQNNPELLVDKLQTEGGIDPKVIARQVQKEVDAGIIRPVDFRQVIVSMISMCIFPFAAKPMLMKLLFRDDEAGWDQFIEERKKFIPEMIVESFKAR